MVRYRRIDKPLDALMALPVVQMLDQAYPDFEDWYVNKLVPDVVAGTGVLIVAQEGNDVVGLAAGKVTPAETKFRCIRVVPEIQGRGIGIKLIDRLLTTMECDRPLTTVSQTSFHVLSRVFVNRFSFALDRVEKGIYRDGWLEYVFNAGAGADLREKSPYGA